MSMISTYFEVTDLFAPGSTGNTAVEAGEQRLSYDQLQRQVERLASALEQADIRRLALYADNSPDWVVVDLACQWSGIQLLPLPLFFSDKQLQHALLSSGTQAVIADRPITRFAPGCEAPIEFANDMGLWRLPAIHNAATTPQIPAGTQKITFTSGSTGTPKGVCLSSQQQLQVAASLAQSIDIPKVRHLCLLPLSTLLENLAGVYAPLLSAGTLVVPSLKDTGLLGSSGVDVEKLLLAIDQAKPQSLILLPQLLLVLVTAAVQGWRPPESLRFVAVGGGKMSPQLLAQAQQLGLPVFEGYGLSECASVVSLNLPGRQLTGSCGQPLTHIELQVDDPVDGVGEIVVRGSTFLGYLNQPDSWHNSSVASGDLGYVDDQGFLHICGRRKNLLISSYGRNINPEWIESELLASPLLDQAVVVGDARPYCCALIHCRHPDTSDRELQSWIERVNATLPDYARVQRWLRLPIPMSREDGLYTDNGRPRRAPINACFAERIEQLYSPPADEERAVTA